MLTQIIQRYEIRRCGRMLFDQFVANAESMCYTAETLTSLEVDQEAFLRETRLLLASSIHLIISRHRDPSVAAFRALLLESFEGRIRKRLDHVDVDALFKERLPLYLKAMDEPAYPTLGTAYGIGKTFATFCERPHDARVIALGVSMCANAVKTIAPLVERVSATWIRLGSDE